jgi:hypothetical protein
MNIEDSTAQGARCPTLANAGALDPSGAKAHGVAALLGHWPQTSVMLSPDMRQLAHVEHGKTALLDLLHRRALHELTPLLAKRGVRGLIVKGAALALSHYPSPGLRPRVDTDLLIQRHMVAVTHEVLTAAGWLPLASNFSALVLPERTYQKRYGGAVVSLDVHWALSARPMLARVLTFEVLFAAATAYDVSDVWRAPCPEHALLIAALHRIGHHREQERMIWLYDLHLVWSALSADQQLEACATAESWRVRALLLDGLLATNSVFQTALSEQCRAILSKSAPTEPSAALLTDKTSLFWFDWRTCGWRERFALLHNRIWAEPSYLRARFAAKSAPIVWLQLRRWFASHAI